MGKPVYLLDLTALAWLQMVRSGVPDAQGSWYVGNTRIPVNGALTYRQTAVLRRSSTATGVAYVGMAFYDAAGAEVFGPGGAFVWIAVANYTPGTGWATVTAQFGAGTGIAVPAGAVTMAPQLTLNYAGTAGSIDCREQWVELSSAPGVALTEDRHFRDQMEWVLRVAGTVWQFLTLLGPDVETLTLRYATGAYITAAADTPAKTQYDARVRQPGLLRMELPSGAGGSITASYGQIVLDNSDGALGDLAYYGLDGQAFTLRLGQDDAARSTFTTVMAGTMQQATVDRTTVTIRLAGRDAMLNQPVCRGRYLGNNALPAGVEGSSELAGQPKPMLYGNAYNVQPPCVNTSRFIYQVGENVGTDGAITNVRVGGVLLTAGAVYADQAAMQATAPAAGQYRALAVGGYFRLGTTPGGVVTCDAEGTELSYGTGDWWWKALYRMAADSGIASGEFQFAIGDNFAQPANWGGGSWPDDQAAVGVWINDARTTVRQAMDQIAAAMGAWYGFVHWGGSPGSTFKFGGDIFPPASAGLYTAIVLTLDASNVLAINAVADPGEGRGVPVWQVDLGYSQNYTPFTPSMAPTVSPLALGRLPMKSLRAQASDAAVLAKNPNALQVVRETAFVDNPTGVAYEGVRQLELRRYTKQWFDVRVSLQSVIEASYRPRLGGYVYLSLPTLKVLWQDGVTRSNGWFSVMAIEMDFARNEVRYTLRQATEQSI